jgi:hypothetical protein
MINHWNSVVPNFEEKKRKWKGNYRGMGFRIYLSWFKHAAIHCCLPWRTLAKCCWPDAMHFIVWYFTTTDRILPAMLDRFTQKYGPKKSMVPMVHHHFSHSSGNRFWCTKSSGGPMFASACASCDLRHGGGLRLQVHHWMLRYNVVGGHGAGIFSPAPPQVQIY